jgi:hypothetical protein
LLEFALSQLGLQQINRVFGVAIEKSKSYFSRGQWNSGLGFLTNIVSAVDGKTSLAIVRHIDADAFEAILPSDVAGETHWITLPESDDPVPARIKAVVDDKEVELFDLRIARARGDDSRVAIGKGATKRFA